MNYSEKIQCKCGKLHKCEIKHIVIKKNALENSKNLFKRYKNILLIADKNTFSAYGKKLHLFKSLNCKIYIFNTNNVLVPNEKAIKTIENHLEKSTDLIVGVGSGVINDLCKYISFKNDLPYFIIASAPSMDGYASSGAALIINNMKITYPAHVPTAIIADTDVLRQSPIDMIKSGIGDIIGKYSALNDWRLSNLINDEFFCENIFQNIGKNIKEVEKNIDKIIDRNEQSVQLLMESLVKVGIAMSYAENSRPASGSEHHIAHYFEITGILNKQQYLPHGIDVLYGTYLTSKIRKEILKTKTPAKPIDREKWKKEIKSAYGRISNGIIELQENAGWINLNFNEIYQQKWINIQQILEEAPSPKEIEKVMQKLELSTNFFEKFYGKKRINDAIKYAKFLKERFTVLWLINQKNVLNS